MPRRRQLTSAALRRRIALAFETSGKTKRQIAKKVRTHETHVNRILRGKQLPRADMLARLVAALEVDGHWLLTGEGRMRP